MSVKNYFHAMSREHGIHPHRRPMISCQYRQYCERCTQLTAARCYTPHVIRFIQTRSDIFEDIALERTCHRAVTQIVAKRPIFGRKEKKSGESGLLCLLQASDFLLLAPALARFCKSDFLAANQKVGSSTLIVKPLCGGPERANADTVNLVFRCKAGVLPVSC